MPDITGLDNEIANIMESGAYESTYALSLAAGGDNTLANPPYTLATFRAAFPQFPVGLFPDALVQNYITTANGQLSARLWGTLWAQGMGLLVGHYLTLWAQSQMQGVPTTLAQVAAGGSPGGLDKSQSAGDVSYSTDYPVFADGWGSYALTSYGQQFITFAEIIGSSSLLVY